MEKTEEGEEGQDAVELDSLTDDNSNLEDVLAQDSNLDKFDQNQLNTEKMKKKKEKTIRSLKGLGLVVLAQLCFSVMAMLVKVSNQSTKMQPFQLVFVRSSIEGCFVGVAIVLFSFLAQNSFVLSLRGYTILSKTENEEEEGKENERGSELGAEEEGKENENEFEEEEEGKKSEIEENEDSKWWNHRVVKAFCGPKEIWGMLLLRGLLGFGAISW